MEIVGRRWNGRVVQALGSGCKGFAEIARHVEGVSDQVLARRLRELESDGLIRRSVTYGRPPAARYALTDTGRSLLPVLDALTEWGRQLITTDAEDGEAEDSRDELEIMAEWGRQDIIDSQTLGATRPPHSTSPRCGLHEGPTRRMTQHHGRSRINDGDRRPHIR
jgi:Predicted transcriptional regulators